VIRRRELTARGGGGGGGRDPGVRTDQLAGLGPRRTKKAGQGVVDLDFGGRMDERGREWMNEE
jgi:hypothetical protein